MARVAVLTNVLAELCYTQSRTRYCTGEIHLASRVNPPVFCCFWRTWLNIYALCCHTALNYNFIFHENHASVNISPSDTTILVFIEQLVVESAGMNLPDAMHVLNLFPVPMWPIRTNRNKPGWFKSIILKFFYM